MSTNEKEIDYKTHILVGVRADCVMTIIDDWPHVPLQADVRNAIDGTRGSYVTFALCTPTSIMPAERNALRAPKPAPSRFGTWAPVRRR